MSLAVLPIKAANTTVKLPAIESLYNYLAYKTKHRWRSVDADCQDEVGSVPL